MAVLGGAAVSYEQGDPVHRGRQSWLHEHLAKELKTLKTVAGFSKDRNFFFLKR